MPWIEISHTQYLCTQKFIFNQFVKNYLLLFLIFMTASHQLTWWKITFFYIHILVYFIAGVTNLWALSTGQFNFFFFCPCHVACRGIPAPWPGTELVPPAVEAWSLNHWTAREIPRNLKNECLGKYSHSPYHYMIRHTPPKMEDLIIPLSKELIN